MLKSTKYCTFLCVLFGTFIYYAYLCNVKQEVKQFRPPAATGNSGTKDMTTIYCITEWDSNMNKTRSELFMSINGVANWLTKQNPINNQFNVTDRETAGDYDITVENLMYVLAYSKANNMAASFTIKRDFFFQTVETRFTLLTMNVNE